MSIYVCICAVGMVITALSYIWWEDRKDRKLEEGKPENDKQQTE